MKQTSPLQLKSKSRPNNCPRIGIWLAVFIIFQACQLERADETQSKTAPVAQPKPLEPLLKDAIVSIAINRRITGFDPSKREAILVQKTGTEWKMTTPVSYSVEQSLITPMLEVLSTLYPLTQLNKSAVDMRPLQLDKELGIQVTAKTTTGKSLQMVVGRSDSKRTVVFVPKSKIIINVAGAFRHIFDTSSKALRKRTITAITPGEIVRVRFINDRGELDLVAKHKKEERLFTPTREKIPHFDHKKARKLVSQAASLFAHDFVDVPIDEKETGLGQRGDRIELLRAKDKGAPHLVSIHLGNKATKKRQHYVKTSMSGQVFLVSEHVVMPLKKVCRDDFARTKKQALEQRKAQRESLEHAVLHHSDDRKTALHADPAKEDAGATLPYRPGTPVAPGVFKQLRALSVSQQKEGPIRSSK